VPDFELTYSSFPYVVNDQGLRTISRVSRDNDRQLTDLVNGLTQQLQAAEDRIGLLEHGVQHFRGRAMRAESWL
jgi:hypothetical protein